MPLMNTLGALVAPKSYFVTLPDGLGWISMSQNFDAGNRIGAPLSLLTEFGTRKVYTDSSGNLLVGFVEYAQSGLFFTKGAFEQLNNTGQSVSSNLVQNSGFVAPSSRAANYIFAVCKDGSGNIYFAGTNFRLSGSTFYPNWYIAKHDSSYNLLWQYDIRSTSTSTDYGYDILIDTSGNPYVLGTIGTTGTLGSGCVSKISSSGTIGWSRSIGATSSQVSIKGSVIDSSNNVYVVVRVNPTGIGTNTYNICKLDSSGNTVANVSIDSILYNIALVGSTLYVSTDRGIIKLDTNLTILAQKQYVVNAWADSRICVNSGNTIITVVGVDSVDSQYIDVIGVDNTLATSWSNRLKVQNTVGPDPLLSGVTVNTLNSRIIITYATQSNNAPTINRAMFSIELPINGQIPMSGFYNINNNFIEYGAITVSETNTSYSTGSSTVTIASQTLTSSAPVASDFPGTSWITQLI